MISAGPTASRLLVDLQGGMRPGDIPQRSACGWGQSRPSEAGVQHDPGGIYGGLESRFASPVRLHRRETPDFRFARRNGRWGGG